MLLLAAILAAAALLSAAGIAALMPWLRHRALAFAEARSSHRVPTPQGAGLAVVVAALATALVASALTALPLSPLVLPALALAMACLLGLWDDMAPLPWRAKLAGQVVAAAIAVAALPTSASLALPALFWAERAAALFALVAMVNVVNFVDGIDEITVAHAVPGLAVALIAGLLLPLGPVVALLAAALLGATLGFWPSNRHPARIFLGDAGALPLGLALGWLAILIALAGHPSAALLMVLYPLTDGGLTLIRRWLAGRRLTEPHRDHAYQRAVDTGMTAPRVALTVALVSLACAVLAVTAILADQAIVSVGCLAIGLAWVLAPVIGWLRRTPRP
ncbi:glycosyl transferase [Phreatobacter sp.]|uniref:glycosyl transferase n=1 Tax=Phreatobacter sp. TaxID=1966341 RepID=UPI0022BE59D0|nr:glycosyl transferase [Phreatobacter sp.]MCZ8316703.1 glycosyl transferase [Phreatobacter sp.]